MHNNNLYSDEELVDLKMNLERYTENSEYIEGRSASFSGQNYMKFILLNNAMINELKATIKIECDKCFEVEFLKEFIYEYDEFKPTCRDCFKNIFSIETFLEQYWNHL